MRLTVALVVVGGLAILAACAEQEQATPPPPAPGTPEWKIQNALSAAPEAVASGAKVVDWHASVVRPPTLREGTNGWMCVPDAPNTPANDPGCVDDQMEGYWEAWMQRDEVRLARLTGMAVGYALQGFQVASLTDPFKLVPDSGQAWIDVPPSVMMVVPTRAAYAGLPTVPAAGPWVLWARSPFALIIVPAARAAAVRADSDR